MTEWFAAGLVTGLVSAGFFYWIKTTLDTHVEGCCVCWKNAHDRKK